MSSVIWAKTDAGRLEMQSRALVKDRATRNLLLVIDGIKSEAMLLANVAGISRDSFDTLRDLGLIAERGAALPHGAAPANSAATAPSPAAVTKAALVAADAAPLDYAEFTATLTQLISKELGLRGFMLTLAVEKAGTPDELQGVARRVLEQIGERRGDAAKALARRMLYGA